MKLDNKELLERLSTSRRAFNATAFAELDRNLSDNEREEWNAMYAALLSALLAVTAEEYSHRSGKYSVSDRR